MHDTSCSEAFHVGGQEEWNFQIDVEVKEEVDEQEDAVVADNVISFSQGHLYNDDVDHLSETKYNNEPIDNCMYFFLPTEAHETSTCDTINEFVGHTTNNENVVENDIIEIALGY